MSEQPAPSRVAARQRSRRHPWLRRIGLTLLILIVATPIFGFAAMKGWVPAPVVSGVARIFVGRQEGAVPWDSGVPANVLIMGLQIGGASTNPLTDSMMVASYQPEGASFSLLSIPRDLWVTIPGHGESRINEAFEYGGAQEAMLTVQQNLGVPVNYYALISYTAFQKLIDDVGGVTVTVEQDIDDPTFPAPDEIHFDPFHLTKGTHHLNGYDALRYARTRHADSDFGRADRQQQVIMALKNRLLSPVNWLKAPLIMHDVKSTIRTNLPFDQGVYIALRAIGSGKLNREVLQYSNQAVVGMTTAGGAQVLAPNQKVIKPIVSKLFGPSLAYFQKGGTVRVDNGNGYKGSATQFSNVLTGLGAKPLEAGDADRTDYAKSVVRVYSSSSDTLKKAKLIAGMLGTTVETGRGSHEADIHVILGREYAPYIKMTAADWEKAIAPK